MFTFFCARLDPSVQWANFVKGVIYYLRDRGVKVDGIDCTFMGSIPMGAGLSSSAALEVATAYAVLGFAGVSLDKLEIARVAQRAENDFAGCNCGLLDQFSSIYGEHHGLIHSDFRSLEAYPVKLPDDVVFLMINPHIKHALSDSPYNARRISCEKAAKELGALLDHAVTALRDVSWKSSNQSNPQNAYKWQLTAKLAWIFGQVITHNHNKSPDIRPRPRTSRQIINPPGIATLWSPLCTNRAPRNWLRRFCLWLFAAIQLRRNDADEIRAYERATLLRPSRSPDRLHTSSDGKCVPQQIADLQAEITALKKL